MSGAGPIAVEPQVFDLLVDLMHNRLRRPLGELLASVCGGRVVADSTLASQAGFAKGPIRRLG